MENHKQSCVTLSLSRELSWRICPEDPGAVAIVKELAFAMKLEPWKDGDAGQLVKVSTDPEASASQMPVYPGQDDPVDCVLLPPEEENRDLLVTQVNHLSLILLWLAQKRGAVLIHGALAELPDPSGDREKSRGIIFAGPGTVGKSTASRRLPPPWKALCDDATLVLPDGRGGFQAQPWPTWSLFYSDGPKGQWDIQQEIVPLTAIFFLSQAPEDSISPLNRAEGVALLMESIQQVAGGMTRKSDGKLKANIHQEQLDNVSRLVDQLGLHSLELSLTGEFWKDVEEVLSSPQPQSKGPDISGSLEAQKLLGEDQLLVRYTGRSMNPTLEEPEIMEIVPYRDAPVRVGDIVYFGRPKDGTLVVHRVISISGDVIRTRGDNNKTPDPYTLQAGDILGKVVAARRGDTRFLISGGSRGHIRGKLCHLRRNVHVSKLRYLGRKALGKLYRSLAGTGAFRPLLPGSKRPKLVLFEQRSRKILKLVHNGRLVGQYDQQRERWKIRQPYRLFINTKALPRIAKRSRRPSSGDPKARQEEKS